MMFNTTSLKHEIGRVRTEVMRIILAVILMLAITGCDWLSEDFEEISSGELHNIKCVWQEPKVTRWFYIGTEDGYHKFIHRDLPGEKRYQVKETEFIIENPKHISSNEVNWVLMPWGPTYEECQK